MHADSHAIASVMVKATSQKLCDDGRPPANSQIVMHSLCLLVVAQKSDCLPVKQCTSSHIRHFPSKDFADTGKCQHLYDRSALMLKVVLVALVLAY